MHICCNGCGRIFTPGEYQYEYENGKMLCTFCDARIQFGFVPPEPFEMPKCPICDREMWALNGVWYCYAPEKHPAGSEEINGENIAPPYLYFE